MQQSPDRMQNSHKPGYSNTQCIYNVFNHSYIANVLHCTEAQHPETVSPVAAHSLVSHDYYTGHMISYLKLILQMG